MTPYPTSASGRDAFILSRRPPRAKHDPWQAHGVTVEQEPCAEGGLADVVTVFLTGRECPWRCAMCDLWKFATAEDTPSGAIPFQIRAALQHSGSEPSADARPRYIKLYNAGSFFDPRAVPPSDYAAIAAAIAGFSRVIVESHPLLVGPRLDPLLDALGAGGPALEVAMGLETVHPEALEQLNKRMTLDQFRHAAGELARRGVALRVFMLVAPPFVPAREHAVWLRRTVDLAWDCGASAVSLIPMRAGNGTVEVLGEHGQYDPPTLDLFEDSIDIARRGARGRVFADVWDLERLASCDTCFAARRSRLSAMNVTGQHVPRVVCPGCAPVAARA